MKMISNRGDRVVNLEYVLGSYSPQLLTHVLRTYTLT